MNQTRNPFSSNFNLVPSLRLRKLPKPAFLALLVLLGPTCLIQAQTLSASAQISGVSVGPNTFNYTITLDNTAASTSPIETFWYAWVPGADFLPSNPLSISAPSGWSGFATHQGTGDGYGIEFTTSTAPLAPGASLDFQFQTQDSPDQLAGNSPFHTSYPVGTSYVYAGAPFASASQQFLVQSVPEPSLLGLLSSGCLILFVVKARRLVNMGNP